MRGGRIDWHARFMRYHQNNPFVFAKLVEMAMKAKKLGYEKAGVRLLLELARWGAMELGDIVTAERYRINNCFAPFYARLAMKKYPSLDGFFEKRSMCGEQLSLELDERRKAA